MKRRSVTPFMPKCDGSANDCCYSRLIRMEALLLLDIRWGVRERDRWLRCSMSWGVRARRLVLRVCVWVLGWVWLLFGSRNEHDSVRMYDTWTL